MSLLNMGGQEIDLLNLKRMQQQMALMNQQAQRMGITGIDTPQLGQQAPAPAPAPEVSSDDDDDESLEFFKKLAQD